MAGIGRSKSRNLFQQEENQIDMKAKRLFRQIGIFSALLILIVTHCYATNQKPKILFVVTSHDTKGNTGEKTGYYLGEVSHPWEVLTAAGYEIDFVSPQGENPPVVGFDLNDPVNKKFWEDKYYHSKITHSLKPSQVNLKNIKLSFMPEEMVRCGIFLSIHQSQRLPARYTDIRGKWACRSCMSWTCRLNQHQTEHRRIFDKREKSQWL